MPTPYQYANDTVTAKEGVIIALDTEYATFRALWVGVAGNVTVRFPSGNAVLHLNVPAGMFPVQGIGVVAAGTTATNFVAWY